MEKGVLFTYALTVIGAVGGVVNPFVGLLVYVCFAIIRPDFLWFWSLEPGQARFSRIVGLALLIGWALRLFGRWRFGRAAPVVACVLVYWGWMTVSAFQAQDTTASFKLVEFFAKVFLPFLVGLTLIENMRQVRALLWVILISQGYVALESNLQYYTGVNKVWEDGFGGMDNNCVAIAMVTGVGLAFFLGTGAKRWWQKATAFLAAGLMAHTILFSFSRGGMLALALTACMGFFLVPKRPQHYLAFALAVLLGIRLAGPEVRQRFMTSFDKSGERMEEASAQSRLDLWSGAMDTTWRNPLFGIGPDNWGLVAPEYGWPLGKEVHSLWIQNAAEVGIPGAILLFSAFAFCMVRLWPVANGKVALSDPFQEDVARMVIAALFGFVIAAQFVTIKYLETPYYVLLAGAAVLKLLPRQPALARRGVIAPTWSACAAALRPRVRTLS
jgi:probable O-glycosylation ligase (exosortase A-associated)